MGITSGNVNQHNIKYVRELQKLDAGSKPSTMSPAGRFLELRTPPPFWIYKPSEPQYKKTINISSISGRKIMDTTNQIFNEKWLMAQCGLLKKPAKAAGSFWSHPRKNMFRLKFIASVRLSHNFETSLWKFSTLWLPGGHNCPNFCTYVKQVPNKIVIDMNLPRQRTEKTKKQSNNYA